MTFDEAVDAMNHGKTVRRQDALASDYSYRFDKYGMLQCYKNEAQIHVYLSVYCLQANDWEVAK